MPDDLASRVISVDALKQFRDEEAQHFLLIHQIMESIGADPTAMTPDADITGVASMGIVQVLTEPRTSILQCLERSEERRVGKGGSERMRTPNPSLWRRRQ